MPGSSATYFWTFIVGLVTVVVVLGAFVAALVIYQRRFVAMHRNYSRNLLKAQEAERAWVAREVHDDAVQRLALLGHEITSMEEIPPALSEAQSRRLDAVREELRDLTGVLRGLAHRLHPALLERGALHVALAQLPGELERSHGLRVVTDLPAGPIPVDSDRALAIYRIAQEALHNVATHAGVADASLALTRHDGMLRLTIADRGAGFDPRERRQAGGMGLIAMRERAEIAGGRLQVTSRPGDGTTVELRIPAASEPAP